MSSELAVEARGLGKRYVLGERGRRPMRRHREEIWALRDATFQIERGQAVGVVGHNGAGKTTLLKILSRITVPTAGEARIRGSVGSLLEVGTGFHPELSGRDNVYLNGAILGMRRREIKAKFDEIVAFAEVERFIDTPVKRYSSGMYVRLAFAVAAHLEPDILIVDEVLAVGDASFQRKCLGKMGEVSSEGRTVLFVSHNMSAIRSLTPRSIWLDHGRIAADGDTDRVVSDYLAATAGPEEGLIDLSGERFRRGAKATAGRVRFESLALLSAGGDPVTMVRHDAPLRFRLTLDVHEPVRFLELYVRVKSPAGMRIFASFSDQHEGTLQPGRYTATCTFADHRLVPGRYTVELVARGADPEDVVPSAMTFRVTTGQAEENPRYVGGGTGVVRVDSTWSELEPVAALRARRSSSSTMRPTATGGLKADS
jgi:lipopolysaccharide transport system ATP-binding protein